jgi:hypothetical protein
VRESIIRSICTTQVYILLHVIGIVKLVLLFLILRESVYAAALNLIPDKVVLVEVHRKGVLRQCEN